MKTPRLSRRLSLFTILPALCTTMCVAQVVVPATPKKFVTRPVGGSSTSGNITITPVPAAPQSRYITHVVLCEARQWTSTEGKVLFGKLIAFEDIVVETPQGNAPANVPSPPPHPTVVRDGNVRLFINTKSSVVSLDRLSQADRDYIEQIRVSHAKRAAIPAR